MVNKPPLISNILIPNNLIIPNWLLAVVLATRVSRRCALAKTQPGEPRGSDLDFILINEKPRW
jgi:hypothetical protein